MLSRQKAKSRDIVINDRTKVLHNGEYWVLPGQQKVQHYSEALRLARAMDYMLYGDSVGV